jgi:hypothetical protein
MPVQGHRASAVDPEGVRSVVSAKAASSPHLKRLEAEAIGIMREAVAAFRSR